MGTSTSTTTPNGSSENPFILKQGRKFTLVVTVKLNGSTVDLSSPARTGRAELRRLASDVGVPVATFGVAIRNQTTDKGKADVTLGATVSAATATPLIEPGDYQMDVEFVNDGDPDDVISSDVLYVRVIPEVTK